MMSKSAITDWISKRLQKLGEEIYDNDNYSLETILEIIYEERNFTKSLTKLLVEHGKYTGNKKSKKSEFLMQKINECYTKEIDCISKPTKNRIASWFELDGENTSSFLDHKE